MSEATIPAPVRETQFLLNGARVVAHGVAPSCTVLAYLRQERHLTGTKEGCAEGDCGACTIVVAELKDDQVVLRTVDACIQFVHALDGKAVFTVECLRNADGELHPVQQAMVSCHGSQCGFCTPGFVMSLWELYNEHAGESATRPTTAEIKSKLTGNLCRCTGYRPIIDAAHAMFDLPRVALDREALREQLLPLQRREALTIVHDGGSFHAPKTQAELVALRAAMPDATVLAGGTDVGLWVTKQLRHLGDLIYIGQVAELQRMTDRDGWLEIGAGVSLNDAYAACARYYPQIGEQWERFASMPIRNGGTLGGNVANGSPIGDSMPWMIALGVRVVLASVRGQRELPLEDLYLAYMKKDMAADEVLVSMRIPHPAPAHQFRTYKLSKRFDSDISAVCAAFDVTTEGDVIQQARIAFGGMAATPKRAPATEAAIRGQRWNESTVRGAMQALATDYAPLSDMRASAAYRLLGAQNLLYRFYLETRATDPLPAGATSVFATA
jgi:xanthine dehydrogenase small subunit